MEGLQIAAIIFTMISLTFGGSALTASEPVITTPPVQPVEVTINEFSVPTASIQQPFVKTYVIKTEPAPNVEPPKPKPNLAVPALLLTIAVLVFGNDG